MPIRDVRNDEPSLTLLGRDRLSALVAQHYVELLRLLKRPQEEIAKAIEQADAMDAFHERWARAQVWKPNATMLKERGNGGFSTYAALLEVNERVQVVAGDEYTLSVVREDGVQLGVPKDHVAEDTKAAP